ncbi:hypothetical protein ABT115_15115 [Streptomyces sp. NPDC001832]|uniref:hypothetical protein n=1 Tax=Streptomyces sp. NPDC001832 TaxID=3154527 RepID=UPI00331A2544
MAELETTKRQRAARTLTAGQRYLIRNLAERAAEWVRAGRRDDLDGVAAILGCILRLVLLAAGAYGTWWLLRRWPAILWAAVPLWCWAAIRAIPDEDEESPAATESPEAQKEQLHALVRDLIGDRPGVHLSTLLAHLQKHGQGEGWEVADLRARLPRLGIPVRRSVKVKRRVAYGVHRDDLPQSSPAEGEQQAA